MNLCDSFFSPAAGLVEQVGRQVFAVLPEDGPIVIIMDHQGNFWPSDSESFAALNISHSFLQDICSRIDDGVEPVISAEADCSIVAAELATERTNCGYVIIVLPHYNPESTLANINLIEMLLNQVVLIAGLTEKNNLLCEQQAGRVSEYSHGSASIN